ncbi:hypothetical protein TNIN_426151 [Trichonephila inaurata madagascariensis]|uniref:Uncharacterized protein n=1 Tax=Trichonephila inaurata madagascariensis TaxID=2747483 RepID=A0A8X6M4W2_9ARAC|nr:hypothetical protein TNIN_426151 [Trichonephila inaurata madagascariensis]
MCWGLVGLSPAFSPSIEPFKFAGGLRPRLPPNSVGNGPGQPGQGLGRRPHPLDVSSLNAESTRKGSRSLPPADGTPQPQTSTSSSRSSPMAWGAWENDRFGEKEGFQCVQLLPLRKVQGEYLPQKWSGVRCLKTVSGQRTQLAFPKDDIVGKGPGFFRFPLFSWIVWRTLSMEKIEQDATSGHPPLLWAPVRGGAFAPSKTASVGPRICCKKRGTKSPGHPHRDGSQSLLCLGDRAKGIGLSPRHEFVSF